jgi:hypothetical protein
MPKIVIEICGGVVQGVLVDPDLAKREEITAEIIDFDDIEDGHGEACGRRYRWADVETVGGESVYRNNGYVEVSLEGCVRDWS